MWVTVKSRVLLIRDGPLEKLRGAGDVQKNICAMENLMKKNSWTPSSHKKIKC